MFDDKIYILDGGLASRIQEKGYSVDGDPLWSSRLLKSSPDVIGQTHMDFLEAGSEILISASYQASIEGFFEHLGLCVTESKDLIKLSAHIAKNVAKQFNDTSGILRLILDCYGDKLISSQQNHILGKRIYIAGSVGPYGACQSDGSEYTGGYMDTIDESQIEKWHRPRIESLLEAGVDILAIETIPSLKEALIILKILRDFPFCKAWVSFSCNVCYDNDDICSTTPVEAILKLANCSKMLHNIFYYIKTFQNGANTNYGDNFADAVLRCVELHSDQLVAIGVNCTHPAYITSLLKETAKLVSVAEIPRVVYPNSGETWVPQHGWIVGDKSTSITETQVKEWIQLGAKIIGGCCRVFPKDIKKISEFIKKM